MTDNNQHTDVILTEQELTDELKLLPEWELCDHWLQRKYRTPGFSHTMMLVNTIGFLAEAAWHHPDLKIGYAEVTIKIQTHRVLAVTWSDIELAKKIDETVTWQPRETDALSGFPKKWIH